MDGNVAIFVFQFLGRMPRSPGVRLCIVGVSEKFDVTCQLETLGAVVQSMFLCHVSFRGSLKKNRNGIVP